MNEDTIKGNWRELKGKVRAQWGRLTDDDLEHINGRIDELVGRIQQRYGEARDKVRDAVDRWFDGLHLGEHDPTER